MIILVTFGRAGWDIAMDRSLPAEGANPGNLIPHTLPPPTPYGARRSRQQNSGGLIPPADGFPKAGGDALQNFWEGLVLTPS